MVAGKVKDEKSGAEGKPSVKSAKKLHAKDPKPGDLSMCRLK